MQIINIIVYDDKGEKSYEINAEKGFITRDRDLIVLWRNVNIKNIKGWQIKTNQMKYFPKEEILDLPVKSLLTWEEKHIRGKAQSIKYYPKRKELEFINSVSLRQNKDNNIIEIMGEHLILNEQNDNGILEGKPAKIKNNQNKIFGNKIIFSFYSDERTIKDADVYEDVLLIYSKEEGEESSDERNIRAVGNAMKLEFDKAGKINSWSLYGNAEVKASEVKENKPLKYILRSANIEGKYKEAAALSEIISPEAGILFLRDFSIEPPRIIEAKAKEISIAIDSEKSFSPKLVSFKGDVEITEKDNQGLSNSAVLYLNENKLVLKKDATWINPDLKIKADNFDIYFDEKKVKAHNDNEKPLETFLLSNKISFAKNRKNSYISSKSLEIIGEKIKFSGSVFFSNNTYILFSDGMEADNEKGEIIANDLKELKIMKDADKGEKNSFYLLKAEKMNFFRKENRFQFAGKTEFRDTNEGIKIMSERITLEINDKDEITKALAEGAVSLFREKINGKSAKAEYKINEDLILLMDAAELTDAENNKLKGEFLTLNLKDDKIRAIGKGYQRTESLYYQKGKE